MAYRTTRVVDEEHIPTLVVNEKKGSFLFMFSDGGGMRVRGPGTYAEIRCTKCRIWRRPQTEDIGMRPYVCHVCRADARRDDVARG